MSKNLKYIKIVTYSNFPFGGACANYLRYFALSLSLQEGNIVEVVLPTGNSYAEKIDLNNSRSGSVENVKYRHLGYVVRPKNYFLKIIDNIFGYFSPIFYFIKERLKNKVDIIIIYNTSFIVGLIFLIIKKIIGKNLIVILPEYYENPIKKYSIEKIKWINFYFGMEYLVEYADKFIVLSGFLENFLLAKNVLEKNILILPNITDPHRFVLKNVNEFKKGITTIGYIGTPTRKDGVVDLINSFALVTKKYKNIHLLIIGDLSSGGTIIPELRKRADFLGVSDKVTFTGLVPFNDVPKLLNSCQILALTRPSGVFAEAGFPTKLGEYFACKRPVLVTSVGDIRKYFVNDVHAVIVKPDDIENIAEGFERLLSNEALREKISLNAFHWVNENLNYRTLSNKINNFIK